ncbi:MAG: SDR family NAD(P)-dependent oxidoreductase [Gammaproteobacteria bacterium]
MFIERLGMNGRVVMVVGAGGGGHGTGSSVALAEAGADLIAVDVSAAALEDVERRVRALGRRCLCIVADARRKAEVDAAVARALTEFGAIHGLVNVVGGMQRGQWGPLLDCPEEVFDDIAHLNLRYAFLTSQAVARSMVARGIGGSIVNLSSVSAFPSAPGHGAYGAAKNGLNTLSRTMALEWSQYGIRVNAVAPGNMFVPRRGGHVVRTLTFDDVAAAAVPMPVVPLGHMGTPVDVGGAVLFLMSDLAAYITGQVLCVDGGLSVKAVTVGEAIRTLPMEPEAANDVGRTS